MINKKIKYILIACLLAVIIILPGMALADNPALKKLGEVGSGKAGPYEEATTASMSEIIGTAISAFLALLGVIFLVLMLYAGYHWLTARGEEEKVTKAKDTLKRAIVGVIIIVAAYAISIFVMSKLEAGTLRGGGGGTTVPSAPTTQIPVPGSKSYPIEGGIYDPDTGSIYLD